jgi:orotate phosphoribosyltransferase
MHEFQREFIEFALRTEVLRFGDFTLRSGRRSPYFFDSGRFSTGESLSKLGRFYLHAIEQAGLGFDMVFGPAYKGIPLAAALAIAYAEERRRPVPYCFNRKEKKDHGEGGIILGAPLAGRVLVVDDVITAGGSVTAALALIRAAGAEAAGVAIALDRQERGPGGRSAAQEVEQACGIRVISIVTLAELVEFLEARGDAADRLREIRRYRDEFGVTAARPGTG